MNTILESNNSIIMSMEDLESQHIRTSSSQNVEMPIDGNNSLYPASSLLKNIGVEHVIGTVPPQTTTSNNINAPSSSRTSSPIYLPTAYNVTRNLSTTTVRDNDAEVSSASTPVVKNTTKNKKNSRPTTPNNTDNNTIATSPPTPLEEDTSSDTEQTSSNTNSNTNNETQISLEQLYRIQNNHTKLLSNNNTKCWDFNYITLLSIAAIFTGIGLLSNNNSNSNMIIISGMVLSPIINQVISLVYGILLLDFKVVWGKMKNIILSLVYCIVIGLLICLCGTALPMNQSNDWPTDEMLNRATPSSFYSGITIAFLTGMGMALTILDDCMSKLVGVAVSASIIPPAVNSGLLLILAMKNDNEWWHHFTLTFDEEVYDEDAPNYSQMAVMSLLLTVANVLLVTCGAILMFRLKEVLPVEKEEFWYDLKVARKLQNSQGSIVVPVSKAREVAEL